jgi:hypothetical protein
MPHPAAITVAFDNAIRQVERARREGMRTRDDADAAPALDRLHEDLVARRGDAVALGAVDAEWIGATVRSVAAWAPEHDLTLLGALGGLAKLRAV